MQKTLEQWELEKGYVVTDASPKDLKKTMTEEEFNNIPIDDKTSFDPKTRIAFLRRNGYGVTRDSLIDPNLPSKPPQELQPHV